MHLRIINLLVLYMSNCNYYLVKYDDNIIGVYDNQIDAEVFILSCYQNRFMTKSATIITCRENSCFFKAEETININNGNIHLLQNKPSVKVSIGTQTENTLHDISHDVSHDVSHAHIQYKTLTPTNKDVFVSQEYIDKCTKQVEINHQLNLLKLKKEKLEESKKVYDIDLKIYYMFKNKLDEDKTTEIPDIFKKKYDVFKLLESDNKLSWSNFVNNYKHDNMYNDYFTPSYHEEMCESKFDLDISDVSDDMEKTLTKKFEEEVNTSDFDNSPTYSNDEPSLCKNKYLTL